MRYWFVVVLLSLSAPVLAGELSDSDLLRAANAELAVPSSTEMEGSGATVSTTDSILSLDEAPRVAQQDVSFGVQKYQTHGTSTVSATESYSLEGLSSQPMAVLTISQWFSSLELGARGVRVGGVLGLGLARSNMNLVSSSGAHYDDVALTSLLPSVGPAVEYFWPVGAGLALGLRAGLGRQFLVQSTTAPTANKTLQSNFLEGGPYLRVFFSENLFVRLEHVRRSVLGVSDLGIQKSNTLVSLGFGL